MPVYDVIVTKSEEVAEGTMVFHFEKLSDFAFTAGQFISVSLINPPETDAEGDTRSFSIASAPYEQGAECGERWLFQLELGDEFAAVIAHGIQIQ